MFKKIKRTCNFINTHPLANKNLWRTYCKFIFWQVQSSFSNKYFIKPFVGNVKFYAKKGLTGITGNIYAGLHEFNDMGFLLHFLRPEDTFFDIGANVGSYTLLASGYIKAKSVAFEPVPSTFTILKENIALNNLQSKTELYNSALGKENGVIKFSTQYDTINHVIAENEALEKSIDVEVKTLDEFIDYNPALLKIDVEGFETEVINGGKKVLKNPNIKAIIIELNGSGARYGYNEHYLHLYLQELGYAAYHYDPFNRSFTHIDKFGSHNTIYIKDFNFVKNRCKTAQTINVFGITF